MPKQGVLTSGDKQRIKISHFIFHIIITDEDIPHYLDEVVMTDEQQKFFKDRLIDSSTGTQYLFLEKDKSDLVRSIKEIINNPEEKFIEKSRELASNFVRFHKKTMSDGVYIISLIKLYDNTPLLYLVKMDQKKVLRYKVESTDTGKRAILEEIINTFVEDKNAIQKSAIIDIGEYYQWDVLAFDRSKDGGKGITDYFRNYLGVIEREDASVLTRKAVNAVRQWATIYSEDLDEDPSIFKERAIQYLKTHDTFDSEEFMNMVVYEEDYEKKSLMLKSLREYLSEEGIFGQVFSPKPESLSKADQKNIRETAEGVRLEWLGSAKSKGIKVPSKVDPSDNLYHISIYTRSIKTIS